MSDKRKPPEAYRFQKGKSGNNKGRPRKRVFDVGEILGEVFHQRVVYRTANGKRKFVTRDEMQLRALIKQALAGEVPAIEQILDILTDTKGSSIDRPIRVIGALLD